MSQPISGFEENLFLTYPHNNGFVDGGRSLILGANTGTESSLWHCDLEGKRTELCRFRQSDQQEKMLWSDTAREAPVVVTIADNKVWLIVLDQGAGASAIYA